MGLIMRDSVPYAGSNDIVLTQAQYDALVQAGEVLPNVNYYISNANHSTPVYASGVHYDNSSSGLDADDVQEAIDEVATVKSNIGNIDNVTLTTSDNNKILGVSVSGDDISVVAVDNQGAFEYRTETLTYNGVDFVFTRRGHVCSVSVAHNSQVAFSTSWTNIGSLSSSYFNTGTQFIGMVIPNGNTLMFRISYSGIVDIMCNVNTNIWAQGTGVYIV